MKNYYGRTLFNNTPCDYYIDSGDNNHPIRVTIGQEQTTTTNKITTTYKYKQQITTQLITTNTTIIYYKNERASREEFRTL